MALSHVVRKIVAVVVPFSTVGTNMRGRAGGVGAGDVALQGDLIAHGVVAVGTFFPFFFTVGM